MGPFREIMESVYHFKRQHKQHLFNNAFQNISCFQSMGVQMLAYFSRLNPYRDIHAPILCLYEKTFKTIRLLFNISLQNMKKIKKVDT